ncbi:phosphatases II [Teratosphaeria nubilosa]|uniref:phosphatidylinositol-3,4,5-trisphosphate 3-phosphatase n=1 Tax=Teratosphaeria nubilosa TaxID=161662 RepID=A0A6G1LFW9_9PEZI|nr:phosphatases II [Teratosphaeria nubilosa]
MASFLRSIVAGPRARHPDADLDLCYVTDFLVATSGPSGTYPQLAYRNSLKELVRFLDSRHQDKWAIWEFRAEGTGYPDEEVYGRVRHYPWPDHHPPPFALIPLIMGSMKNWLKAEGAEGRVAVVHCKAGKGRSGTVSCSYLVSEEGWTAEDAMQRFTDRRMKPGFGAGISIPSQLRTISYVDRWTKHGKVYVDRPTEIVEVHIWGLRNGVKVAVEGYVEEGKVIKTYHTFQKAEREIVRGSIRKDNGFSDVALEIMGKNKKRTPTEQSTQPPETSDNTDLDRTGSDLLESGNGGDVIFRPSQPISLPTSDINLDFERRNKSKYGSFAMVTAVAHVWFNTFFEGLGPEQHGAANDSGVFEIEWDAMDGIKGSSRKGTRAFDRLAVVWKCPRQRRPTLVPEPGIGEACPDARPADWRRGEDGRRSGDFEKKLGLREADAESGGLSRASSVAGSGEEVGDEREGTKGHVPGVGGAEESEGGYNLVSPCTLR